MGEIDLLLTSKHSERRTMCSNFLPFYMRRFAIQFRYMIYTSMSYRSGFLLMTPVLHTMNLCCNASRINVTWANHWVLSHGRWLRNCCLPILNVISWYIRFIGILDKYNISWYIHQEVELPSEMLSKTSFWKRINVIVFSCILIIWFTYLPIHISTLWVFAMVHNILSMCSSVCN